jgi:hypothetical protein
LSEQMAVALPIVSQARNTLTRLFSFSIFVVAKAKANVTARGRPSGTATTMMVTATIRISKNAEALSEGGRVSPDKPPTKRKRSMKNKRPAAEVPILAIAIARPPSFSCRGVGSISARTDIMILPKLLLTPTEVALLIVSTHF